MKIPFAQQSPTVFEGSDLVCDLAGRFRPICRCCGGRWWIGEVELAGPYLKGRTIGITGVERQDHHDESDRPHSAGAGVPSQVGGNIGTPVCAMVETSREDGWNVLELSSFQLETIAEFRAHIGWR
jgi:UDP-N-acetylmuramoylalanine--D-glutamate ligase